MILFLDMNESSDTIETFRQETQPKMIEKGVIPPKPNSPREQELYQQWLEGKRKIQKRTNGN